MTPQQLRAVLASTDLTGIEIEVYEGRVRNDSPREYPPIAILGLAGRRDLDGALETWHVLRQLVEETGLWPIVTYDAQIASLRRNETAHFRLNASFDEIAEDRSIATPQHGTDVHAVLAANGYRVDTIVSLFEQPPRIDAEALFQPDHLNQLAEGARRLQLYEGRLPSDAELDEAVGPDGDLIETTDGAEWWLHQWVMENIDGEEVVEGWSDYRPTWIQHFSDEQDWTTLLLPGGAVDVAAALDHYRLGGRRELSLLSAQLMRQWRDQWRAEPVIHDGLGWGFRVQRPPRTIREALPLALEHAAIGPCVLDGPGLSIYRYAYTLVNSPEWMIFERV